MWAVRDSCVCACESHTAPIHVNYHVRELYVTHVYVHVSHIQLPYTVINMQDGGGHIYVWKGHSRVGVTHVWRGHSRVGVTHMWGGHWRVGLTHVWRGHSRVGVTHVWRGHSRVGVTHVWRGHSRVGVTHVWDEPPKWNSSLLDICFIGIFIIFNKLSQNWLIFVRHG